MESKPKPRLVPGCGGGLIGITVRLFAAVRRGGNLFFYDGFGWRLQMPVNAADVFAHNAEKYQVEAI